MKPDRPLSGFGNHQQFSMWHPILDLLERVVQVGLNQWMARCPAHADHTTSLSIRILNNRVLLHCFAGCVVDAILTALGLTMRDLYLAEVPVRYRPVYREQPPIPDKTRRETLERVWNAASPLSGQDDASSYLAARGIHLKTYPDALRYHHLEYWNGKSSLGLFPALLGRVEHPHHGFVSVHRTFINRNGIGKADVPSPKKLMTPVFVAATRGAAIRLYEPTTFLAVSEGIETALTVAAASGWPTWSCVSASGLQSVLIPDSVCEVVICADHDDAGVPAAKALALRLLNEGKTVRIAIPPVPGTDWNDALTNQEVTL